MNFERFTGGRFFAISATVKHWESPGKAGGLPRLVNGGGVSYLIPGVHTAAMDAAQRR